MADLAVIDEAQETSQASAIFELLPGKVIDFQVNHPVQVRLKLSLVGYETGKYIILKYPTSGDNYSDVLVEGNVAIVRYLVEGDHGCCFAFRSTIRNITKTPERFIVLNYPKKIENRQLRAHQRVTTHMPAAISLNEPNQSNVEINGIIVDLSLKGCGFTFRAKNDIVNVKQRQIFVCVTHYAIGEMRIPATVCNSRNEQGRVSVGIKFEENDKQVALLLENLFVDLNLL
ncbi:PilZ domain-containing protein [Thalassotalea marina]|uniref:Flagellar brake protein n=1 Tax=Thalassotalea marina TaxID=1673741 RepID=A0A919ELU2_9GAMM|nr:flagellar brake protein [Thalassotalea marina]GHF96455.1 hypothetical protein GCM10017161_26020 [Thalassotalea marina]